MFDDDNDGQADNHLALYLNYGGGDNDVDDSLFDYHEYVSVEIGSTLVGSQVPQPTCSSWKSEGGNLTNYQWVDRGHF